MNAYELSKKAGQVPVQNPDDLVRVWDEGGLGSRVEQIAYRLGVPGGISEDFAQETVLRMLVKVKRGEHIENPEAFARTAVKRLIIDSYRRRSKNEAIPLEDCENFPAGETCSSLDIAVKRETRRIVFDAVGKLKSVDQRTALSLDWEGLKDQQIADIMGKTLGAIKVLLSRARANLAHDLDRTDLIGE